LPGCRVRASLKGAKLVRLGHNLKVDDSLMEYLKGANINVS
jgi:hypothetical protein